MNAKEVLQYLKPQRVQYPWTVEELLEQRQRLLDALESHIDKGSDHVLS